MFTPANEMNSWSHINNIKTHVECSLALYSTMFGKCRHVGLQTGKYQTQIASMDPILALVVTQFYSIYFYIMKMARRLNDGIGPVTQH